MISIRVKYRPSSVTNKEGVIYYQLIQNRESRLITTPYKLYYREWDDENSIINISKSEYHRRGYLQNIEQRIMRDITNLQRVIDEADDVEIVIQSYNKLSREGMLFEFARRVAEDLTNDGRTKTSASHKTAIRSFSLFCNGKDMLLDNITPRLIKQYDQYLKSKCLSNNTRSFYMRILRAIYNRAVSENIAQQIFPFKGVYVGIDKTAKRAVDQSVISCLKSVNLSQHQGLDFARDVFMFSFYARGMAFVDVANLTYANIKEEYIVYQRHKTGQELRVRIEPCLKSLLSKYASVDTPKYLLPILSEGKSNYDSALRLQNMRLRKISSIMGLIQPLSSYVARHSWATLAKRRGIPVQIISESMGHNNEKTTLIYLSSLDNSVIDQINAALMSEI